MYRPQLAYPTPPGYQDLDFVYAFDSTNTPALSGTLAVGQSQLSGIPLLLQQDAPFLWRATRVNSPNATSSSLSIQFKDCNGNYLADSPVQCNLSYSPAGLFTTGLLSVVQEPEIVCPPGGIITVYLSNQYAVPITIDLRIMLIGVKRVCNVRVKPLKCVEAGGRAA